MRRVLRWLFIIVIALLLLLVATVVAMIDDRPLVRYDEPLTSEQLSRVQALLTELDPRRMREGEARTTRTSDLDLSLIATHLLRRWGGAASLRAERNRLSVMASVPLPRNAIGGFLNVELGFGDGNGFPPLTRLRIGRVTVPRALAGMALRQLRGLGARMPVLAALGSALDRTAFEPGAVSVRYRWRDSLAVAIGDALIAPEDAERLRVFHGHLAGFLDASGVDVSLAALAPVLFERAGARADADAGADNRAVILVLAAYVNAIDITRAISGAAAWPRLRRVRVTVHGRIDLPKHFLTSAALAAGAGGALAQAFGLQKEVDDAAGGSGFSFVDLLADEAGTRFGIAAIGATARSLQQRAAAATSDAAWIPDPARLDERMPMAVFQSRYGAVGSARYNAVIADIDRRIDASPLWR
jgi:hypothetical protein